MRKSEGWSATLADVAVLSPLVSLICAGADWSNCARCVGIFFLFHLITFIIEWVIRSHCIQVHPHASKEQPNSASTAPLGELGRTAPGTAEALCSRRDQPRSPFLRSRNTHALSVLVSSLTLIRFLFCLSVDTPSVGSQRLKTMPSQSPRRGAAATARGSGQGSLLCLRLSLLCITSAIHVRTSTQIRLCVPHHLCAFDVGYRSVGLEMSQSWLLLGDDVNAAAS